MAIGAGQQQVSDVGARDEEHQSDHRHQGEEGLAVLGACIREPRSGRAQGERSLQVLPLAVKAPIPGERGAVDLLRQGLHFGFCLLRSLARTESAQNAQPPPVSVGQRAGVGPEDRLTSNGDRDVEGRIHIQAREPGRGHTDNGERVAVQPDGFADDIGIPLKMPLPEAVADYRHRIPAQRQIIGGSQQPSLRRR